MPHTYEQKKQYLIKLQQENPQKYEEIKQKKREANKKYRETHKEQIKQKEKEYRETHKEQIKETKKKYLNRLQQENPEKYQEYINRSSYWIDYNNTTKIRKEHPNIDWKYPDPKEYGIKPKKYQFIDDE